MQTKSRRISTLSAYECLSETADLLLFKLKSIWQIIFDNRNDVWFVIRCKQCLQVKIENDRVRVFDVTFKIGDKAVMHHHPDHVV